MARNFEGEIVDQLNGAVAKYRSAPEDVDELKIALLPIASSLAAGFDVWLQSLPHVSRTIVIKAHLEGGKMETAFTPYHCEHGEWKPHRSWSHEFDDERDEDVAGIEYPLENLAPLVAHMSSFVTQVDVSARNVPTAGTVPHV
jgi:hypothetical protein